VLTFYYFNKIPEISIYKSLFWLIVLEVPLHNPWALLLWVCGKAARHGRSVVWNETAYIMSQGTKKKEGSEIPQFGSGALRSDCGEVLPLKASTVSQ
jgi:hypothetical protein